MSLFGAFFAPIAAQAITTSKAEGVDRSAAAKAASWTGTIIGINEGEHSFVITEGTKLDHITTYAQRSVRISANTDLYKNGDAVAFSNFDIGDRITVSGGYNSAKRIITATQIIAGKTVAAAPTKLTDSSVSNTNGLSRNLQVGSRGADVTWLQTFLKNNGYFKVPTGTAFGLFGTATKMAVQAYQRAVKLPITGTVGPMTRAKLNG